MRYTMINPFSEVNWKPDETEIRKFGKTLIIGFFCIATLLCGRTFWVPFYEALKLSLVVLALGAGYGLFALLFPRLGRPLYMVWYGISCCIGIVVSNTLLMLFYYVLFSPFVIILRLVTGRDPLQLKKSPTKASYWCKKGKSRSKKSYLKQY